MKQSLMVAMAVAIALLASFTFVSATERASLGAQQSNRLQEPDLQEPKEKKEKKKDDALESLGPNKFAGRVRAIVVRSGNPSTIWAASATGGLWVSRDDAANWTQADDFMESLTFSSLVADPQNTKVMYAGSGEIHVFLHHLSLLGDNVADIEGRVLRSPHRGVGVFKTTDGGATWRLLPFTAKNSNFYYVNRIAVHPVDTAIVLAATNTGLWRSSDAGASWGVAPLFPGIVLDVKFDPSFPPVRAVAGTYANGVFHSTNDAASMWSSSTLPGTPLPAIGTAKTRIELGASASEPGTWLAAHISNEEIRLLRSTDNGVSFDFLNGQSAALTCAGLTSTVNNNLYTGAVWVDPNNDQRILVGGVNLCYSTDGGRTFTVYPDDTRTLHNDHHAIVENLSASTVDRAVVYVGNDGGINRLGFDNSPTHLRLNNGLGIQQFVGAAKNPLSGVIVAGAQDIGTLRRDPDGTWNELMNPGAEGADGIPVATDPTDARYWYFGKTSSWARRSSDGAMSQVRMISDDTFLMTPLGGIRPPIMLDPSDPNVLYLGSAKLWRTREARTETGSTWQAIKPAVNVTGSEYHIITAMAVPPSDKNQMWVGTGSKSTSLPTFRTNRQLWWTGELQTLAAGEDGTKWDPVDIGSPLPVRPISSLAISPRLISQVFVAFAGWTPPGGVPDNLWRVFKQANGAYTFTNVSAGLPPGPIHSVSTHPSAGAQGSVSTNSWVYAGTEAGLYLSRDAGASWSAVPVGLARVPISDLSWSDDRTLVIATYGRGVWELDQPANPERVFAETVAYRLGNQADGRVENLVRDDGRFLVSSAVALNRNNAIRLELTGRAAPGTTVAKLTFLVKSSVNTTVKGSQLTIEFFNFTTGRFESVAIKPAATTDTLVTVDITTQPARFVGPTGELRATLTWTWNSTTSFSQSSIDKVQWTVLRLPG